MNLVVCDANILFAGLLDPDSLYSKILAVLAYGSLHQQVRAAEVERQAIEQFLAENPGAQLLGSPVESEVEARCRTRIARMEEFLPAMPPTNWGLATSRAITEEVYNVAMSPRSKLGGLDKSAAEAAVNLALSISVHQVVRGLDGDIPGYTEGRDIKDDPVIHTAILAQADWLLSQDKRHISLDYKRPTIYRDPSSGRQTGAVSLRYFIGKLLCTGLHFDEADLLTIHGGDALKAALS